MVFNVHFSFDTKKVNITKTQNNLIDYANKFNASNFYFIYEDKFFKNNIQIYSIFNVIFEDCDLDNMLKCIKNIRNMSKIYLDCIFEENIQHRLIYASKNYLLSIEKNSVSNYNKFHRERSYSETDAFILSRIFNKYTSPIKNENEIKNKENDNNNDNIQKNINTLVSYEEYLKRLGS